MAGIADIVAGFFKPVADVIDHLTVSGDAKVALQKAALEGQITAAKAVTDYEQQLLDGQIAIIKAEATGSSWLQKNWRPITMVTFLVLVVCDSFGWLPNRLAPDAWGLLKIGLGGYTVGRSVEKIALPITQAVLKK